MDKPSAVLRAWTKYQEEAGRDPFSPETKRAATAYKRALTVARKRALEGRPT